MIANGRGSLWGYIWGHMVLDFRRLAIFPALWIWAAGGCGQGLASIPLDSGWKLQDAAKVAESGPQISQAGYGPAHWYAAVVPGTVLTSLVADGVYPDPLYGENNRPDKIPESLCRASYWYRLAINLPEEFAGRRVWLQFDGINYAAEVWVNGRNVGTIKGSVCAGHF